MNKISILFTFSTLINLITTEKNCGNFIPKSKDECFVFTDISSYCCFFTNPDNKFYDHCDTINHGDYMTSSNSTIFSGVFVQMDCGTTVTPNNLNKCGKAQVSSKEDCFLFSSEEKSCCYYNHMGKKGCVQYDLVMTDSVLMGNVILQCSSFHLTAVLSSLLILIFIVLPVY